MRRNVMLETVVGLLAALSIASERLVEIIKGLVPALNNQNTNSKKEALRKAALQFLAVIAGIATTVLAYKSGSLPEGSLPSGWNTPIGILAVGLLASGGSGLWNATLGYLLQVKELKKKEVKKGP
jgi:hypothetical protein